jgi:chromosome partitioning protein
VIGREARATLTEHRIAPLASEIHQRIVFAESVAAGRLAFELDPDSPAAREITALAAEVMGQMR